MLGLLNGAFMFTADLLRALAHRGVTPVVDFISLSSYGAARQSAGAVTERSGLRQSMEGRHVLIVDDIHDTGLTLAYAKNMVTAGGAGAVTTCVLLDKPGTRDPRGHPTQHDRKPFKPGVPDHVGFVCPDCFVVGYGLDDNGRYRELPFIAAIEPAASV